MRLLLTRPEPDASVTAELLRGRGHTVDIVPLLRLETIVGADLGAGPWGGIVITSASAARAIAAHPRMRELVKRPVFAVGRRSAAAARAVGFAHVASADGDARDLVRLVAARAERKLPLLYLAGEDRAADLELLLAAEGVSLATAVVYRAVVAPGLPPAIGAALTAGAIDGVLHYSRRSADAFVASALAARIDLKPLKTKHYCISPEVAGALRQAGVDAVATAAQPDQAALFALID